MRAFFPVGQLYMSSLHFIQSNYSLQQTTQNHKTGFTDLK